MKCMLGKRVSSVEGQVSPCKGKQGWFEGDVALWLDNRGVAPSKGRGGE